MMQVPYRLIDERTSVRLCVTVAFSIFGLGFQSRAVAAESSSCFNSTHPRSCQTPALFTLDDSIADAAQVLCEALDREFLQDVRYNISLHDAALSKLRVDSELCARAHEVYSSCVWCTPNVTDPNEYCRLRSCDVPSIVDDSVDHEGTCDELFNLLKEDQYPLTIDLCARSEQSKHTCPSVCNNYSYLGATTKTQKNVLIWVSRTSAFLSFTGACYLLFDILSKPQHRATVYHQLVAGMAFCDIFTAAAWFLATAPIPNETIDEGWYVVGARGSKTACTAQAFFIQLGFTSVFYNVSLALYYLLVIVYNFKNAALQKIRPYLLGVPFGLGVALALSGIPVYGWKEYSCHVWGEWHWTDHLFTLIPIGNSIVFITGSMLCVSWSVRRKVRASRRWSTGDNSSSNLQTQVYWQASLYAFSFYTTWPVVAVVYLKDVDFEEGLYWYTVLVSIVGPLQGFNNFLVYIRPKAKNMLSLRRFSNRLRQSIAIRRIRRSSSPDEEPEIVPIDPSAVIAMITIEEREATCNTETSCSAPGGDGEARGLKAVNPTEAGDGEDIDDSRQQYNEKMSKKHMLFASSLKKNSKDADLEKSDTNASVDGVNNILNDGDESDIVRKDCAPCISCAPDMSRDISTCTSSVIPDGTTEHHILANGKSTDVESNEAQQECIGRWD